LLLWAFCLYLDLLCVLPATPDVSSAPRTMWYLTPGKSFTLPPLTNTIECSCKLCPSPGMHSLHYHLSHATLRIAEFGFFGVVVNTRTNPSSWGQESKATDLLFLVIWVLPVLTNCWIVIINTKKFLIKFRFYGCKCRK
jgi:hypothetical protein